MRWSEPTHAGATRKARGNAKALRAALTPPERWLWRNLRDRLKLENTHFRRQVAIGRYVADFACLTHRLIVEVDGEQHSTNAALHYDAERTAFLEAAGFRVLRFSNRDVMKNVAIVLDTIFAETHVAFDSTSTPSPSPQGGGGHAPKRVAQAGDACVSSDGGRNG